MENEHLPEWNPTSAEVTRDQRAAYDAMRHRCPVAHHEGSGWTVFKHADVVRVLLDPDTFSNAVSRHLSVPNGMDPPEHTHYRRIIEPYFSATRMSAFEPRCRELAAKLVRNVEPGAEVEFMSRVAEPFAVAVQCSFLGWPESLQGMLVSWMRRNQQATLAQDRTALAEIAREFEAIIYGLLETRRNAGAGPEADLTASLMHEKVWGRQLTNEELASILRNWTAGEIGTISAAAGILVHFIAARQDVQGQLRSEVTLLPAAIDEILRIRGPLVSNRRVATKPVEIAGKRIDKGGRITVNWVSANRDEQVFGEPDEFRLDRDPKKNLLYGAGIHVCPGAPLARLELRVLMEQVLGATRQVSLATGKAPELAVYPASGFAKLPVVFDF